MAMKKNANIETLIKKKCKEYGIPPEILTPEELEELKEEIKAEQNGEWILDGVLFGIDLERVFEYQQRKEKQTKKLKD